MGSCKKKNLVKRLNKVLIRTFVHPMNFHVYKWVETFENCGLDVEVARAKAFPTFDIVFVSTYLTKQHCKPTLLQELVINSLNKANIDPHV